MESTYDKIQYYNIGREQKASIISKLKVFLGKEEQIQEAWVFGSFTRHGSIRDIDVAIRAEPELPFKEYLNLNAQMELELGMPVDLVQISKAPKALEENILGQGTKIK
jgi:predicted nucleotidyltransferase